MLCPSRWWSPSRCSPRRASKDAVLPLPGWHFRSGGSRFRGGVLPGGAVRFRSQGGAVGVGATKLPLSGRGKFESFVFIFIGAAVRRGSSLFCCSGISRPCSAAWRAVRWEPLSGGVEVGMSGETFPPGAGVGRFHRVEKSFGTGRAGSPGGQKCPLSCVNPRYLPLSREKNSGNMQIFLAKA